MASRRKGRIIAFQALFSWEMNRIPLEEITFFPWLDPDERSELDEATLGFAREIVAGTIKNIDAIDAAIRRQLQNWDIDRLGRVDLATLRLGIFSLAYQPDIPATVTIDEAVDIAKKFGGDDSYRFVNGVLDGYRKANFLGPVTP